MGTQKVARQTCQGHHQRPFQGNEKVFESSCNGAMRTLGVIGSNISSLEVSTCPAESVDDEVCYAGTTSRVFIYKYWTFFSEREF